MKHLRFPWRKLGSKATRTAITALLVGACATPAPPRGKPPAVAVHSARDPGVVRARALYDLGRYAESLQVAQVALESARKSAGPSRAHVSDALQCEAQAFFRLGRYQDSAVTALNEAADIVAANSKERRAPSCASSRAIWETPISPCSTIRTRPIAYGRP